MGKTVQHRAKNAHTRVIVHLVLGLIFSGILQGQPVIIDHLCTDITRIPEAAITQAKSLLHIAYGHTSHGSQVTDGMSGLVAFANGGGKGLSLPDNIFAWNNGGTGGALDLEEGDGYGTGWLDHDCGYYPAWVNETRTYLDDPSHSDVNVIIWSWCGQASSYTEQNMIDRYLTPMSQLETDYPDVTFVYMTGHSDGTGLTGNLHLRNEQIRSYCIANNKVIYDFNDIENYDPDGNYYGDKWVNDACAYDSNNNGYLDENDGNWATTWQGNHIENVDWYSCNSAHSQPLNANQKAYAAWWLWATLGGWDSSLPVHMGVISASPNSAGDVVVRWETHSETGCSGFHVWRSAERNDGYIRLTTRLIAGQGCSASKQAYEFIDRNAEKEIWYWYRVEELSTTGESTFYDPIRAQSAMTVPLEFGLDQNYPNPFNPATTITYRLAESGQVEMQVVNIAGQVVRTLIHTSQEANQYTVSWNGRNDRGENVPSGVYFITLKAGDYSEVRKTSLMR